MNGVLIKVLWWDYRKLAEPMEQMWIDPTKKQEKAQAEGGLCLDFEQSMVSANLGRSDSSFTEFITGHITQR